MWFEKHSAHSETNSQEHQFFVELLMEVITILSANYNPPILKSVDTRDSGNGSSRSSIGVMTGKGKQTLENLFLVLDLEEPEVAPDVKSEDQSKKLVRADDQSGPTTKPIVIFEIENEKEFAEETLASPLIVSLTIYGISVNGWNLYGLPIWLTKPIWQPLQPSRIPLSIWLVMQRRILGLRFPISKAPMR